MNRLLSGITILIVVVGLFLAGGYIEYSTGFPFAIAFDGPATPALRPPVPFTRTTTPDAVPDPARTSGDVPIVSNARGAEDAPRADVPMGETIDLQRCYETMIARRLIPSDAKTVCAKLIGGISR